jgi:tRNA(Ile)-lysidine synthetase-like protein
MGIEVVAAYFDHGLRRRREIDGDVVHARAASSRLQVPLRVGTGSSSGEPVRGGPEAAARAARYRFLECLAGECCADWIAVGHTADDRAETVLMRALQGTGVAGLGGMRARRGRVIRPLETLRRDDLQAWLDGEGLSYRRDSQNGDPRFTRNRVRDLLGDIERRFPGAATRLAEVGRQAEQTHAFVAAQAAERLPWRRTALGIALPWQEFRTAPEALQMEALFQGYDLLLRGTGPRRLPRRFLLPILRAAGKNAARVRGAGHGVVIERLAAHLVMSAAVVHGAGTGYLWKAVRSGSYRIPETQVEIRRAEPVAGERTVAGTASPSAGSTGAGSTGAGSTGAGSTGAGSTGAGSIGGVRVGSSDGPLLVRSCRPGDEIRLHSGVKPLAALLREWGAPEAHRWMIPVVADRRGVLAVCGAAFGYQDVRSVRCTDREDGADGEGGGTGAVIAISRVEEES